MPYRHAWIVLLALIGATFVAFWPAYVSRLGSAPAAWHIHGLTAGLWLGLLVVQSWSIHHDHRALHRTLGLAVFAAIPLLLVGAAGVVQVMARATASGADPFYTIWGPSLGTYDLVAFFAFPAFVAMAMRNRRIVQLHARYMLATPLLLTSPILVRILDQHVPGLIITGPQDFHLFRWSLHLSVLLNVAIAAWLHSYDRRYGRPWLLVGGISITQSLLFETLGFMPAWKSAFIALGTLPDTVMAAIAIAVAAAALWFGWTAVPPRRPRGVGAIG